MIKENGGSIGKFFGLLILGFITITVFGICFQKKEWKKFPEVTYQLELKGVVSKVRIDRGTFVEFQEGEKFSLPSSDNLSYSPYSIGRFIKQGDSIVKPAFSDSISVFRNEKKYHFVLGKRIDAQRH